MRIVLHEIELDALDPEASKRFYHDVLGLRIFHDQPGLKVFDSGLPGVDVDASVHFLGRVSISFLVDDIDEFVKQARAGGTPVGDPVDAHLGMRAVALEDPDGHRIAIQAPTEQSPEWLRRMVR